jgi:hypothetical protein
MAAVVKTAVTNMTNMVRIAYRLCWTRSLVEPGDVHVGIDAAHGFS